MDMLFLLQFACCVITGMLALLLILTRFQMRWLNRRYEVSRWLICTGMMGLAAHYVLQMIYGFRASGDEIGAVVNILFYAPIEYVISYATFNLICYRGGRKQFGMLCVSSYALILACFFVGALSRNSLHIGFWLYIMLGLFTVCMIYSITKTYREMRHHRRIIQENTAEDLLPFDSYACMSYISMGFCCLALLVGIVSRSVLVVIAPFVLLSVVIFIISFVGYGFNIVPMDIMLEKQMEETEKSSAVDDTAEEAKAAKKTESLSQERIDEIEKLLAEWCEEGGFCESSVNMPILSSKLCITRAELTAYFEIYLQSSFRTWLGDIRFKKAQSMLLEYKKYSNDAVSIECGFSSHAHLYKIFKAKTGMTPMQWRELMRKKM